MTLPHGFTDKQVSIEYANMAKLNKIRAVARKNRATVHVQRYAYDAYSGHVTVPTAWDEGVDAHNARVAAIQAIVKA